MYQDRLDLSLPFEFAQGECESFQSQTSLFRTKESPLNLRELKDIKTAVSTYLCSMMMLGAFPWMFTFAFLHVALSLNTFCQLTNASKSSSSH